MQMILGAIPNDFTKYWIERFPHLVSHSFHALEKHSYEDVFKVYYDSSFRYAKPAYFHLDTDDCVWPDKFSKKLSNSPRRVFKEFQPQNNERKMSQDTEANGCNKHKSDTVYRTGNKRGSYNFHKNAEADGTVNFRKNNNWRMSNSNN